MATSATISISLPEDILSQARAAAEDQKTGLDEVVSNALEREFRARKNFGKMLHESREWGYRMGIRSEEDVERVANGEITLEELRRSREQA